MPKPPDQLYCVEAMAIAHMENVEPTAQWLDQAPETRTLALMRMTAAYLKFKEIVMAWSPADEALEPDPLPPTLDNPAAEESSHV